MQDRFLVSTALSNSVVFPSQAICSFGRKEAKDRTAFSEVREFMIKSFELLQNSNGFVDPKNFNDPKLTSSFPRYLMKPDHPLDKYLKPFKIESSNLIPVLSTGGIHSLENTIRRQSNQHDDKVTQDALAACYGIEAAIHKTYADSETPAIQKKRPRQIHMA